MDEILKRLDLQDEALQRSHHQQEQVLWLLKGSEALGIEGVIPSLKSLKKEVHELSLWKYDLQNAKGKIELKYIGKWIGGMGAVVAAIVGIFELLRMIF